MGTCSLEDIFWRDLGAEEMRFLRENGFYLSFEAGEKIFRKGERCVGVFLIVSGEVDLFDHNDGGQDVHIRTLSPGMVLGDMGTFGARPCEYTARSKTPVQLFNLERDALESLASHNPRAAGQLFVNVITITAKVNEPSKRETYEKEL
jgi:CRP-like cAMP-binding protein